MAKRIDDSNNCITLLDPIALLVGSLFLSSIATTMTLVPNFKRQGLMVRYYDTINHAVILVGFCGPRAFVLSVKPSTPVEA